MDFDYQKIKDEEAHRRDERIRSQNIQQPKPMPRQSTVLDIPPNSRKPPIKPRRSIKCRPISNPQTGESQSKAVQNVNEEVKRIAPSQVLSPAASLDAQTPCLQAHNLLWFQRTQLPRLSKPLPCWLYGFTTRREAEQLLQDKQQGCFLLRLSESKLGFVLSYRGTDKCRHFIIEDASDMCKKEGQYYIVGEDSKHSSLEDLLKHYNQNPVGPFNETLTVPCIQTSSCANGNGKLEVRIGDDKNEETTTAAPTSASEKPEMESTNHDAPPVSESAQYAVVKKGLRRTQSNSECLTVPNHILLLEETPDSETKCEGASCEPVPSTAAISVQDVGHTVDVQYARVNKPPREVTASAVNTTNTSVQEASTATDPQMLPGAAATADEKYCILESMHTYEETLQTHHSNGQISFYAMGRRRDISDGAGDRSGHHVYSEVNIRGNRDDSIPMSTSPPTRGGAFNSNPSSSRPRLPLRPPPRLTQNQSLATPCNPRMNSAQSANQHQTMQPFPENSNFSIYEQIPERTPKSRPALPPPNQKR